MLNRKSTIVNSVSQVNLELGALGLTPKIVRNVAIASAAARAESLEVDPSGTPGTQSYIYGVRNIRLQLLPLGWKISRAGNVESTINHELGVQLCFQNVDRSCGDKNPESISGKGSASRKLIHDGQVELFPATDKKAPKIFGSTPTVWMICVSTDEGHIRAEVSCPEIFEGEQFEGFIKRIFVVDELSGPNLDKTNKPGEDDDALDFEVKVTKK